MIVILLKQDDRYVLKAHNMGIAKNAANPVKPIIKLSNLHHRPVATGMKNSVTLYLDKCADKINKA